MHGQIGFEFIISAVVFMITIVYASTTIISMLPLYHDQAITEHLQADAYILSQYLLFDNLSAENYVLDMNKIAQFNERCSSDYEGVLSDLGYSYVDININVDGTTLLECHPAAVSEISETFYTNRFALVNNNGNKIIVMRIAAMS
ncbi:MAG: hypothetical protein ABIG30_00540 [Candidatus Aenigmatarchaeota archaeon]